MIIPWRLLDSQALQNVIEYFVLREGTDYGLIEKTLAEKVTDIMFLLETNKAVIVWSEQDKTIDIKMC